MNDFEMIAQKLREGMYRGNMHACLRDIGRLAGGCVASGRISSEEARELGELAAELSINRKEAAAKWREAVEYGAGSPAYGDVPQNAPEDIPLGWNHELRGDEYRLVRREYLEVEYLEPPDDFDPCGQLLEYMTELFKPGEYVGYVTETFERDGRLVPTKGVYTRTAGEIIAELRKKKFDNAVGTVNEEAGAWIRFNPFDGQGVKDENVTDFRYALVECDSVPVEEQVAIYRKLELPCAFIVHSGGKSAHAIVRINADSPEEYRRRVDFLYQVCAGNGLEVDRQNRNPSRLSRMPGAIRKGTPQYIIDRHVGKPSWVEWENWIQDQNDDLPEIENATMAYSNPPSLAPELIGGILRQGHKMRVAGPSKAGKSFLLLELAIAISEGWKWLGRECRQGAVLYINLELDPASCMNRIHALYGEIKAKTGAEPSHTDMLHVWNLRGRTLPMDKLTPKIIRRCRDMGLAAIIIDPIYKVLTGDENSAADMAKFCNYFDRVARDCGCSVIDCHHHSKGSQGEKRSMDRASGSGVFARDPDALLDMIELDADAPRIQLSNEMECEAMRKYMDDTVAEWDADIGADDKLNADRLIHLIERDHPGEIASVRTARTEARQSVEFATAWRIEATLREFPPFKPMDVWFRYPLHMADSGLLADALPAAMDDQARKRHTGAKKPSKSTLAKNAIEEAFQDSAVKSVNVQDIADKVAETCGDCSRKTVENAVNKKSFHVADGIIYRGGK